MKYGEQVFVNSFIENNQGDVLRRSSKQRCVSVTDVVEFFKHLKESSLFQGCSEFVLYVLDNADNRHLYAYLIKDVQGKDAPKYKLVKHYCFASSAQCIKVYKETKKLLKLKDILLYSMNSCSKNSKIVYPQLRLTYDLCEKGLWQLKDFSSSFLSSYGKDYRSFECWCDAYHINYVSKPKDNTKVVIKGDGDVEVLADVDGNTQTLKSILDENKRLRKSIDNLMEEQEDWKKKKEDFERQCIKLQYEYRKESTSREALEKELNQVKQQLKTQDFEMWLASVSCDEIRKRNLELTKENQELKTKYAIFEKWQTFLEELKRLGDIKGNETETTTIRD